MSLNFNNIHQNKVYNPISKFQRILNLGQGILYLNFLAFFLRYINNSAVTEMFRIATVW